MKKILFFAVTFFIFSKSSAVIKTIDHTRCFCSDICELRNCSEEDKPFVDEETGILFCKPRDKRNYEPQGCKVRACMLVDDIKLEDIIAP